MSADTPASPTSETGVPGPAAAVPARPSGPSRRAIGAVATVVVVAVVVVILFAGLIPGIHPFGNNGGSSSPGATTEAGSFAAAQKFANGVSGGPWALGGAIGSDYTLGVTDSSSSFENSTCPLEDSGISTLTLPGYNGSYSTGYAEAWLFLFASTSSSAHLFLVAQNGVVSELGEVTAAACYSTLVALPSGLTSSTAAASAAASNSNVTAFVSTHPHANATYQL
jgi:hypothetical protein